MHVPVLLLPERHLYLFGLLLYMLCNVLACNACCCFAREVSRTGLRCLQEKIGFPQCLVRRTTGECQDIVRVRSCAEESSCASVRVRFSETSFSL